MVKKNGRPIRVLPDSIKEEYKSSTILDLAYKYNTGFHQIKKKLIELGTEIRVPGRKKRKIENKPLFSNYHLNNNKELREKMKQNTQINNKFIKRYKLEPIIIYEKYLYKLDIIAKEFDKLCEKLTFGID